MKFKKSNGLVADILCECVTQSFWQGGPGGSFNQTSWHLAAHQKQYLLVLASTEDWDIDEIKKHKTIFSRSP